MISPQPHQTLRIIDVNLNRACEGLRVLEDTARLLLDDATLSRRLKVMRHQLATADAAFNVSLLQSRDAAHDVGQSTTAPGQEATKDLTLLVVANSRRVQESLRTIEEFVKTGIASQLNSDQLLKTRFEVYEIEREMVSRLNRRDGSRKVTGLHAIIDTEALAGRKHLEIACQLINGGARAIQLRDKITPKGDLIPLARELRALCEDHGVLFIMNDYLDLALASGAHGLHLGQDDLPLAAAREMLPINVIVGISTHSVTQAQAAAAAGADYIAVGSVFPTPTKDEAIIIGLDGLRQIREAVAVPIVAIGGITAANVADVMGAGADSVAVISAILRSDDPEISARQIVNHIEVTNETDGQ